MNNLKFTTLPLTKALNSLSFYISYAYISYNNIHSQPNLDYKFKSFNIDKPESKINIYLDNFDYSHQSNYFKNLDDLLDNYIEFYITFLNNSLLDILNQNIFSKLFNKQKNNNLIDDLKAKIEYLNKLLNDGSKSNIDERFKFMQNHFDFAFVTNNNVESLDHNSFFINVVQPINISDSIFSIKKNTSTLINLKVLSKNLNFRLNLMHQLEERPFNSYLKATINDVRDMKSEYFYSFDYKLEDSNTKQTYTFTLDYSKNKYVLKNKDGQEQEFVFITHDDCLDYINNQKEKLTKLQNQMNEVFV